MQKIDLQRINMLKDLLNRRMSDPYLEVPLVNTVLQILGYAGYFDFNEDTYKITWRLHKHDKGDKI